MTTNAAKPVIYYGLFASNYLPSLDEREHMQSRYIETMGVTSFSQNKAGTRMAHGHSLGSAKRSVHRKADGMCFYLTQDAMDKALKAMHKHDDDSAVMLKQMRQALSILDKDVRIEHERLLNLHAVQPAELED